MSAETTERDWVEEIGKPTFDSLAEMVAALECDYERLEELRDSLQDRYDDLPDADEGYEQTSFEHYYAAMIAEGDEEAEELKALKEAAGECKDREEAERRIHEDPLSVEVRSGWAVIGDALNAEEFCILLGTGGPATRIRGKLDEHGEPIRAWLEVQDWGKPWTEYYAGPDSQEVLLTYSRCFCFAS